MYTVGEASVNLSVMRLTILAGTSQALRTLAGLMWAEFQ